MKKYLFMIVVACVALACSKDNIQNDATPDNVQDAKGNISFVVDVESISDSKATISASDNFTWEDSDCAAVYTSEGSKVVLTPSGISGGVATFTGDVPSGETVVEGAIVVYPAAFLTAANTVTFPATYATNGQGTVLAAKVASGRKLTFKYLAATLKATITDVPSIATSITVTSTQTLTGEHTIDFSGSTPTLSTSSTAKEITFSSPANGNNELIIPVPKTGASQTFTYNVNYSSNVLFTQSTTKTLARNTYMSMAPLTINPSVYLVRNLDGDHWSDNAETLLSSPTGTTYSTTLKSFGGTDKYFRYDVKYGEVQVKYGNSAAGVDGISGGSFVADSENAALLRVYGLNNYTIDFDYVAGTFTVSQSPIDLYAIGIAGEAFDNSQKAERVICDYYCWTGTTTGTWVKLYEDGITDWSSGGTYPETHDGMPVSSGSTLSFYVNGSDFSSYFAQNNNNKSTVVLKGAFDNWDSGKGVAFVLTRHYGLWKISNITFDSDTEAKIVVDGSWTGTSEASGTTISGNRIYNLAGVGEGSNFTIAAGTYDIGYNDNTNTLYFEKK